MKRSNLIYVLIFALSGGLLASYLVSDIFVSGDVNASQSDSRVVVRTVQPTPSPQIEASLSVLVPTRALKVGARLVREDLGWAPFANEADVASYISSASDSLTARENLIATRYLGAFVTKDLLEGKPIEKSSLILNPGRGFLSALLPAGAVAMSIPVNYSTAVSGFVLPGDYVDIVASENEGSIRRSRILLNKVRVIAVDSEITTPEGEPTTSMVPQRTVTFELSPRQALALTDSAERGDISLLLHSVSDNSLSASSRPLIGIGSEDIPPDVLARQRELEAAQRPIRVIRFGVAADTYIE